MYETTARLRLDYNGPSATNSMRPGAKNEFEGTLMDGAPQLLERNVMEEEHHVQYGRGPSAAILWRKGKRTWGE